jgi:hypothetical protein
MLCRCRVNLLSPESPNEDDGRGGIEERAERKARERKAAREDGEGERRRAGYSVQRDGDVGEAERRRELRSA